MISTLMWLTPSDILVMYWLPAVAVSSMLLPCPLPHGKTFVTFSLYYPVKVVMEVAWQSFYSMRKICTTVWNIVLAHYN